MTDPAHVVPAPAIVTVPVAGGDGVYPVRRIYCVHAEHIREMGADERELPFFFQKPADAIVLDGAEVAYPSFTEDFQYEIELVLAIGREGADIAVEDAAAHVFGVAVGIDLTRRDVQIQARKSGRPWEVGKSFDHSAPIGALVPLGGGALPDKGEISLSVNGDVKQSSDLSLMIWDAREMISQLSRHTGWSPAT